MRAATVTVALVALIAGSVEAQGRRGSSQGIPPGQLPPAGLCRVWYDGVPPGRQPRPVECRDAERIASRDRSARVIYGSDRDRNDGWWDPRDDGRARPRAVPRDYPGRPYPQGRYPSNSRGEYRYQSIAFDNGYNDGLEKGREDSRDRDSYDPNRHSRYRSADRGYESRYGSKDAYRQIYRDGFEAGYDDAYRRLNGDRSNRNGIRLPWPF
jgi:hypothetical protein